MASRTSTRRAGKSSVRKPMAKSKLTHKKTQLLNQNGSAIGSVIDILRGQLAQLEEEIKADKAGVKAYRAQLKLLHAKKHQAEKRLAANQDWAAQFDRDIGPFEKKYHTLTLDIHALYENARTEHGKGVELLMDAFDYHPEFKRFSDTFSAVPFRPSKADAPPEHATSADALAATKKKGSSKLKASRRFG